MGCGFEQYLLTFQWDRSLILPVLPKIEISQDRRAPTASWLPTARLRGVRSFSELLTQIPSHQERGVTASMSISLQCALRGLKSGVWYQDQVFFLYIFFFDVPAQIEVTSAAVYSQVIKSKSNCEVMPSSVLFLIAVRIPSSLFHTCQWTAVAHTNKAEYLTHLLLCWFDSVFVLP